MAEKNGYLIEHEKQVNKLSAQVMQITFLFFTLVFVMNLMGIFKVDKAIMTTAYVVGSIVLIIPSLLIMKFKINSNIVKYLVVAAAVSFVTLLSTTLTYHVVVIYVYPIAIASLYFSKKLNLVAAAMTVVGVSIGQIIAFVLQTLPDDNFKEMKGVILFGIIPRALILVALAAIFTTLGTRTSAMLSNLMGAEEQEHILEHMQEMKDNAIKTSDVLCDMVEELSDITEGSIQANRRITEETETLLTGATENTKVVDHTNESMQNIMEKIMSLSKLNHETALLTEQIEINTQENQSRMDEVTQNMKQIYQSTNESKQVIFTLGEASKEIIGIVQTITNISGQTRPAFWR